MITEEKFMKEAYRTPSMAIISINPCQVLAASPDDNTTYETFTTNPEQDWE